MKTMTTIKKIKSTMLLNVKTEVTLTKNLKISP